jgi:HK97 family phage major capsid protein
VVPKTYGLEDTSGGEATTSSRSERRLAGPFQTSGSFFAAVRESGRPGGATDPRLLETRSASGLNETVGSEGGFLVQPTLANELIRQVTATSKVFPRCRRWPVGANSNGTIIPVVDETSRATGSRLGGVQGYWLNEADQKTPSKPKFGKIELNLKKLVGLCYTTDELLQDSNLLGQFVEQAFTEELSFMVDDAIIRGTGAGMPLGILTSPARVIVAKEPSQAASTILFSNVVKMYSRLPADSISNAVWFVNQNALPELLQMVVPVPNVAGTDWVGGSAAYLPAGGAAASPYGRLLGLPVIPIEQASAVGDEGDIILADCSKYFLIDKPMQTASTIFVRFLWDESVFRFVYRVDGCPGLKAPITPYKGSDQVSPFVVLAERASS